MGAGLALECKLRYPEMFVRYKEICEVKLLDIGKLYLYKTQRKWILNFPTKYHWKYDTKPEYIEKGLQKFVDTYKSKKIESVAFPLLGANNGGLSKDHSLALLKKYVSKIDIPVEIYMYDPTAPDELFTHFRKAFLTDSISTLKQLTHLNEKRIDKIKSVLETMDLKNMNQLGSIDGIGEATLEKCFKYAMHSDTQNNQMNLF